MMKIPRGYYRLQKKSPNRAQDATESSKVVNSFSVHIQENISNLAILKVQKELMSILVGLSLTQHRFCSLLNIYIL